MKQRTAIATFKKFEMSNPGAIIGGNDDGPIIDKKKLADLLKRRRR